MKSKSSLFMLAPVAVSLMMLVILFNPVMANHFAEDSRGKGTRCSLDAIPFNYSDNKGIKRTTCISRQYVNELVSGKLSCPFSSAHASWVQKRQELLQSARQDAVDKIHVHGIVRSPAPGSANLVLQREMESINSHRRLTYVF